MTQVSFDDLVVGACRGSIVSFPTDTVPALAVQPDRSGLIFEVKQRYPDKPLILMAATAEELWPFCQGTEAEKQIWQQVAQQHWPGAITLVLPASDREASTKWNRLPPEVNPKSPTTIGVRVPNCAIASRILAQTGPLATTSANLSGQPPLLTMAEIDAQFPEVLTLLPTELEHKPSGGGVPSTVAQWTDNGWIILRQGAVRLGQAYETTLTE